MNDVTIFKFLIISIKFLFVTVVKVEISVARNKAT